MKFNIKSEWIFILIILTIWLGTYLIYPHLPDQIPTHWNIYGEIDQWSSKFKASLILPGTITGIYLLFLLIPYIEPRRKHFLESLGFYQMIKYALIVFLTATYALSLWASFNNDLSISIFIPMGVGILFILIGNYLSQIKSNFLMGIRTPWTLSSEESWKKTHRLGGITFAVSGLMFIAIPFLKLTTPWNFIIPMTTVTLAAIVPIIYSYIYFLQDKDRTKL